VGLLPVERDGAEGDGAGLRDDWTTLCSSRAAPTSMSPRFLLFYLAAARKAGVKLLTRAPYSRGAPRAGRWHLTNGAGRGGGDILATGRAWAIRWRG
jgi:hypothetical protein